MASASVHPGAELCLLFGALIPGPRPPLSCWQKGTCGLLLSICVMCCGVHALALPYHGFPLWGGTGHCAVAQKPLEGGYRVCWHQLRPAATDRSGDGVYAP